MATNKTGSTAPDNMKLWNSVCTTDPQYTKRVNQRGGFTAIGAQSQLMEATRMFGPIGTGFGVSNETFTSFDSEGLCLYQATLWYKHQAIGAGSLVIMSEFPIHSSIRYTVNGRIDDDFAKKVATDALTKGLSKLGFNADVFLGLFDDNKYVNQLKVTATTNKVTETNANKTPINKTVTSSNGTITDEMKAKIILELNKCNDKAFITKVNTAVESGKINTHNFNESLTKVVKYVKADVMVNKIKEVDKQYGEKKKVANE